jgi:endonuclease-3
MSLRTFDLRTELLNVARLFYDDVSPILIRFEALSPFELLISTIVSQNTNWKNVERAMKNMRERGLVTVDGVLKANLSELEDSLRVAGLYRVKARRIKEIAERLRSWGVGLEEILSMSFGNARAKLMELPAVGRKTADVMLAFKSRAPVIPVDTHIERVAKRIGLVDEGADYEEVRLALESFVPHQERALFHLALIKFGREVCRARNPSCSKCPLSASCKSSNVRP